MTSHMRYLPRDICKTFSLVFDGQFSRVWNEIYARAYRKAWDIFWLIAIPFIRIQRVHSPGVFRVETNHPVAFESPDHIFPRGTEFDNSRNRKFVIHMDSLLRTSFSKDTLNFADLGCSGGGLVSDFLTLRWRAVGLEGSDYSLKHRRAEWKRLANRNLFTCNIAKPYRIILDGQNAKFHLITAWEVLEHIPIDSLESVFSGIIDHLESGGYFIASTTETPDFDHGVEFHQTQWTNSQWRNYIAQKWPQMVPVAVGLKTHQFVRYNLLHPSFLIYRKT